MKLEQQCCSLELAKQLKELGVKLDSYFEWYYRISRKPEYRLGTRSTWEPTFEDIVASAFTVAELGEILPHHISTCKIDAHPPYWICSEDGPIERYPEGPCPDAETEVDARAKMLIYLLENGLLDTNPLE